MSYSKNELKDVIKLCNELSNLAAEVLAEGDHQYLYNMDTREHEYRPSWPYSGGTKASGALRRRSLDMTRALAELRKS